MKSSGVSTGFGDGTYKPTANVTRQAMSAFMRRAAVFVVPEAPPSDAAGVALLVGVPGALSNAEQTKGLDATFRSVASPAYGTWLLAVLALGLLCYGLYCLLEARYRDLTPGR